MKIIERNNNNAILELEVIRKYKFPGFTDFINIAKATFDREKAKRVDATKLPVEFARYDLWKCELTLLDYYCIVKWINREYTGKIVPVEQSYLQTRTAYLFGLNCFYPRQLDHDNRYDKYLPNYFTFFIDRRGTDDFIRALESMEKTKIPFDECLYDNTNSSGTTELKTEKMQIYVLLVDAEKFRLLTAPDDPGDDIMRYVTTIRMSSFDMFIGDHREIFSVDNESVESLKQLFPLYRPLEFDELEALCGLLMGDNTIDAALQLIREKEDWKIIATREALEKYLVTGSGWDYPDVDKLRCCLRRGKLNGVMEHYDRDSAAGRFLESFLKIKYIPSRAYPSYMCKMLIRHEYEEECIKRLDDFRPERSSDDILEREKIVLSNIPSSSHGLQSVTNYLMFNDGSIPARRRLEEITEDLKKPHL